MELVAGKQGALPDRAGQDVEVGRGDTLDIGAIDGELLEGALVARTNVVGREDDRAQSIAELAAARRERSHRGVVIASLTPPDVDAEDRRIRGPLDRGKVQGEDEVGRRLD